MSALLRCCLLTALVVLIHRPSLYAEDVRVTVLAILATDRNDKIDDKIKCIADEVRKEEPTLTGFKLVHMASKSVEVGKKEKFPLVDDEAASIVVNQARDMEKDKRIGLTVKAPRVGEITYRTCCSKFFPIVTRYQTKDGSRLILAVMVKPCELPPKK